MIDLLYTRPLINETLTRLTTVSPITKSYSYFWQSVMVHRLINCFKKLINVCNTIWIAVKANVYRGGHPVRFVSEFHTLSIFSTPYWHQTFIKHCNIIPKHGISRFESTRSSLYDENNMKKNPNVFMFGYYPFVVRNYPLSFQRALEIIQKCIPMPI